MQEHTRHLLALSLVPQLGPKRCRKLIEVFGHPKEILSASKKTLLRLPHITSERVKEIQNGLYLKQADAIIEKVEQVHQRMISFQDKEYPHRLQHTPHAPLILYSRGNCNLNADRMIGVVGTRTPSPAASLETQRLISTLSGIGVTIVSGLAYGIDACAHKKAIEEGLPTIGVLGGAIDMLYPARHRTILQDMLDRGGAISEFPPGVKAEREHFPMRNRLIAGMSDIVVVMESGVTGGSMITARIANDYDREVGAFPGRVGDPKTSGCNLLIKQNEAHLIESGMDVLALMQWNDEGLGNQRNKLKAPPSDADQRRVYNYVAEKGLIHIDQLTADLDITAGEWSMLAINMEMNGYLTIKPGNIVGLAQ